MDHVTLKPPQRPKEWVRRDLLEMDDEAELAHFENALARWAPLFFYFTLATGPSPEVREKLRIFRASSSHHLRHDPIPAHPGPPWGGAKVG
jgi:hypothetical protein